jgi:uracil-DNA glycosylase
MSVYADRLVASAENLGDWGKLSFFDDRFQKITSLLADEAGEILPPAEKVFAALESLDPNAVRVVILGQDPYPTPGHANGLAFSVERDIKPIPRSLSNVFKEMTDDIGTAPKNGDLSQWAAQGVLLLNTSLTVQSGEAGSHAKIGWSALTQEIIAHLANLDKLAWVLWGKHAQNFEPLIDAGNGKDTLILKSAHPSPLSARRGYFGSKPFSQINNHLKKHGLTPIDWTA